MEVFIESGNCLSWIDDEQYHLYGKRGLELRITPNIINLGMES